MCGLREHIPSPRHTHLCLLAPQLLSRILFSTYLTMSGSLLLPLTQTLKIAVEQMKLKHLDHLARTTSFNTNSSLLVLMLTSVTTQGRTSGISMADSRTFCTNDSLLLSLGNF